MSDRQLPEAVKKSRTVICEQKTFGGLWHHNGATGEQIYDMANIMPTPGRSLQTRSPHWLYVQGIYSERPGHGLCVHNNELMMARGTRLYRVKGKDWVEIVCTVEDSDKEFVSFGDKLIVLPDGVYYDSTKRDGSHPMSLLFEKAGTILSGTKLIYEGEDLEALGFHVGDGIELTYPAPYTESDTYRITAMKGDTMIVDHSFPIEGLHYVTLTRPMPRMDHMCAVGNRLMGCGDNTVYISEGGNPFNWCAASGLGASAPLKIVTGGQGVFTGCTCWQGYGVFFKEDRVYKLVGSSAGSYHLADTAAPGVAPGAMRTLSNQGGALYYCSSAGVCRYEGSYPEVVGTPLGRRFHNACGAGDGRYYYLTGQDEKGSPVLYIYDTQRDEWFEADDRRIFFNMVTLENRVYGLNLLGEVWRVASDWESAHSGTADSQVVGIPVASVTFGYENCRLPEARRLRKISVLADAAAGHGVDIPTMTVRVSYDADGDWEEMGKFEGTCANRLLDFPLCPRPCDFYRLKLEMTGSWQLHKIYREYEM